MCDHINWDEIKTDENCSLIDRWGGIAHTSIDTGDSIDVPLLHDDSYSEIPIPDTTINNDLWTHCHWSPRVVTKAAGSQLLAATAMCGIFMIGELVGGYLAGSLAIMCDAAHLLSDCAGFLLALSALFLARRPSSPRMSYGYQRAEVIGALLSILLIWLVTGIFVYLAILRLWKGDYDIRVDAMMIVSGVGMCVNVLMALILHGACPNISHAHSHSNHVNSDCNSYNSNRNNSKCGGESSLTNGYVKSPMCKESANYGNISMDSFRNDSSSAINETTSNAVPQAVVTLTPRNNILYPPRKSFLGCINRDYSMREIISNDNISNNGINHGYDDVEMLQSVSVNRKGKIAEVSSEHSINVRAAAIHVLGDLIQSAGVFIASVIIKIYPEAKIVDPLCTFIFSIIVMCTTLKILREAVTVLMEGVPHHVRYESVLAALRGIAGVRTVHSLHIWSLTNQYNMLTAHLAIDQYTDFDNTLKQALYIVRTKFKIDMATIQVERYNEEAMTDCAQCHANTDT